MVTDSCVVTAGRIIKKRAVADGGVFIAGGIIKERLVTVRRVFVTDGVAEKRRSAESAVVRTRIVIDQRGGSDGRALCAAGVEQKRRRAHCSIGIPVVERERSTPNGSIKTAGRIAKECIPTKTG